ncbi:MAG: ribbon-helix-helix domain-containing protein [Myxococcaceae bacterium]
MMETKVLTAHVPLALSEQVDQFAQRIERSRGWILKQALSAWVTEEQERYQLTLESMKEVDQGKTVPHSEVKQWLEKINASN